MRNQHIMSTACKRKKLCIDVAFYNAPLIEAISHIYPDSPLLVMFRRCESFVRSATVINGEDLQPAGWPAPEKSLTAREQFISLGRLKPEQDSLDSKQWDKWSGISRNIWLWYTVNLHLYKFSQTNANCTILYYEDLETDSLTFWRSCLDSLGIMDQNKLNHCLEKSNIKINSRKQCDVGTYSSWTNQEQTLFKKLAFSLEKKIYDRRT